MCVLNSFNGNCDVCIRSLSSSRMLFIWFRGGVVVVFVLRVVLELQVLLLHRPNGHVAVLVDRKSALLIVVSMRRVGLWHVCV